MNQAIKSGRGSVSRVHGRLKMGLLCSFTVLAAPAASTCGPAPVDLTGTWVSRIVSPGTMTVPVVGTTTANIDTVMRLVITSSGGNLVHKVELCKLATPTTPDPMTLVVTYRPAMLATMVATASIPTYTATVGGPVTIPQLVIQTGANKVCTGSCVASDFIDSDGDAQPGVTLPSVLGGSISLDAYGALTTTMSLTSSTLQDANTMVGNASFTTDGQILKTSNPSIPGGQIKVVPAGATAYSAKHLAGDVPCSTVVGMFP